MQRQLRFPVGLTASQSVPDLRSPGNGTLMPVNFLTRMRSADAHSQTGAGGSSGKRQMDKRQPFPSVFHRFLQEYGVNIKIHRIPPETAFPPQSTAGYSHASPRSLPAPVHNSPDNRRQIKAHPLCPGFFIPQWTEINSSHPSVPEAGYS